MNRLVYIFIVLLLPAIKAAATVKLHSLFSDNMVIQRELPIHIFGTADQVNQSQSRLGTRQSCGC